MKKIPCVIFSFIILSTFIPILSFSQDINDLAYENRINLKAGTIWNIEGKGDCLIFPYYDVRKAGNSRQITNIAVENTGEYGIVAKLRFRDWARGAELFSKDIWIPSAGTWNATVEINEDGTNAIISGWGDVIFRQDGNSFYFTNALLHGVSFSTMNLRRRGYDNPNLYGFVEVIGAEKTSPTSAGGKTTRLAKSERDCPNTLRGSLSITRVEEGSVMSYDAVAIGNFSRGQGSLFRSPGSPYPRLDQCEDTLDQLEFQLSKWEIFGPFSIAPSVQGKTSLIVTFPTKLFHYKNGKRIHKVSNPFEAMAESQGETFVTSFSKGGVPYPSESEITLPYSVNVIGLYQDYYGPPLGGDNLVMPAFSYESGEAKLTSDNMAQRTLIKDYEYFRELFTAYRGLPALGVVLREYRNPPTLHTALTPAEFSAVWEASSLESILFPTFVNGPTFGQVNEVYAYTTGGASSNLGHPIQYEFDWGDGTSSGWLDVGVVGSTKGWTTGGAYAVKSRARCAFHPDLISKWSKEIIVVIESVSPPSILNGPVVGLPNILYTYSTGGSVSNVGHPVQYFFEWGDGTDSNWLPVGVTSAAKFWSEGKTYTVRARARCAVDALVVSDWTPDLTVKIELISTPSTPVGETKGIPGVSYTYMTGGASSNINDPIEYQFDWGDGTFSGWQLSTSASKTWTTGGTYSVRARARCATHTHLMSNWSPALTVNIERITTPGTPTQAPTGAVIIGQTFTYSTGGSASNIGDPVQYFFDWGDGTSSGWLPVGTTSAQKTWSSGGQFIVRAKARCAIHTHIESDWSPGLTVDIETVSTPTTPTGPTPVIVGASNPYTTGGSVSSLGHPIQYQFDWEDGTTSAWGNPSANKTWTLPGTYRVRARARCQTHPTVISDWSEALEVTVSP